WRETLCRKFLAHVKFGGASLLFGARWERKYAPWDRHWEPLVDVLEYKLTILRKIVPVAELHFESQDLPQQIWARRLQRIGLFQSEERFIKTPHHLQHRAASPPCVGGRLKLQGIVITCERLGKLPLVLEGRCFVRVSEDISRVQCNCQVVTFNGLA